METLPNFPFLNQLTEDPNEVNSQFDCVATSIAACMKFLVGGNYTGAQLKDAVYGKNYQGGTAASAYVDFCAKHGIILQSIKGQGTQLTDTIRAQIKRRHAVIGTEPDSYVDASLGWSHVIAFYEADNPSGTLSAMDPFGGWKDTRPASAWASTLEFGEIWALYKEGDQLMGGVPAGWKDDSTTKTLTAPSNHVVLKGFRDYILANEWNPGDWPLENESSIPIVQISNTALGPGSRQRFRLRTLIWTKEKGVIEMWTGEELISLENHLKDQLKQVAQLQTQIRNIQSLPNAIPTLSPATKQLLEELATIFVVITK